MRTERPDVVAWQDALVQAVGPAVFDNRLDSWRQWQAAPWGRLRYAVVGHVLRTHLEPMGPSLRVLDVGGGDGREAVSLAQQGHTVTLVDYSGRMLSEARRAADLAGVSDRVTVVEAPVADLSNLGLGAFDAVLCHFLIGYVVDARETVDMVAGHVSPGGLLSLVAANHPAAVLAKAVVDLNFSDAERLASATVKHAEVFDQPVGRVDRQQAQDWLIAAGLSVVGYYGARAVMGLIADNDVKHDPDVYAAVEKLEIALCGVSPYRDIAASWQLVARRPAPDG